MRIYRRASSSAGCGGGARADGSHHAHALHSPVLVAALRVGVDERRPSLSCSAYHRLLVWDIMPARRHRDRRAPLNPLIGKSLVVYLEKSAQRRAPRERRREVPA